MIANKENTKHQINTLRQTNTKRIRFIREKIKGRGVKIYFLASELGITPIYMSMMLTRQKPVSDVFFAKIQKYFQD